MVPAAPDSQSSRRSPTHRRFEIADGAVAPMRSLEEAALKLAQEGFRVLPLRPNGKVPLLGHGHKDATALTTNIAAWWRRWPNANVGVVTGGTFFVVDIDVKNGLDGELTWSRVQQSLGKAPTTRTVLTPHGGRHLYFGSSAVRVQCSVGRLGDGIDIRGIGGFVVAAGVIDGRNYGTQPHPIAAAPPWLLELVYGGTRVGRTDEHWRLVALEGAESGRRNATVASLAGHLLRRGIDPWVALELMRTWNQARVNPPLPDDEVVRIVDSIAGKELRRRQGIQ